MNRAAQQSESKNGETEEVITSTAACDDCGKRSTWGGVIHAHRETHCGKCGKTTWHTFRADLPNAEAHGRSPVQPIVGSSELEEKS
jgi:ribosomal protein S27AE